MEKIILRFDSGTALVREVEWCTNLGDDVMGIIDEIYNECPEKLKLYRPEDVLGEDYHYENYLPVNGGEYYTDMIWSVEWVGETVD